MDDVQYEDEIAKVLKAGNPRVLLTLVSIVNSRLQCFGSIMVQQLPLFNVTTPYYYQTESFTFNEEWFSLIVARAQHG